MKKKYNSKKRRKSYYNNFYLHSKHKSNFMKAKHEKNKNRRLNYKKVFIFLAIVIFIFYLAIFSIVKLFSNNNSANTVATFEKPKDITINMAVVRRYNVPFIKFPKCI